MTSPIGEFSEEALRLTDMLIKKHQQYGESYKQSGQVLKLLYPNGIKPEQYGDMLAVTRIVDKLFRIAVGRSDDVENWRDVAGYGLIMKMRAGEAVTLSTPVKLENE